MKHLRLTPRHQAGFTIVELLITIAIIVVIASMAIPKMTRARLSANESKAMATLRSIAQAEIQVSISPMIDTDSDGVGECGYFAELAGSVPHRIDSGAGPGPGGPTDILNPESLNAIFGSVNNGVMVSSGYVFQMWLPDATVGGLTAGIPEDVNGGKTAGPFPDSDNGELLWAVYAWPLDRGKTGTPTFFINNQGQLLSYLNTAAVRYSGIGGGPNFDAAFTVAGDMASTISAGQGTGADGNVWNPLK